MKLYVEYGVGTSIKNISTFQTSQCNAEVFFNEPVDTDKLPGYRVEYDYNNIRNYAVFDETQYQAYLDDVAQKEAVNLANDLMRELSQQTVLDNADDIDALVLAPLYPEWSGDGVVLKEGQRIRYEGTLYKVLQAHTTQADWTPESAPSLYAKILHPDDSEVIVEWIQPDSTNGYKIGDTVIHNDKVWKSTADNNVWEPGTTGAPWEEVIPKTEEETTE